MQDRNGVRAQTWIIAMCAGAVLCGCPQGGEVEPEAITATEGESTSTASGEDPEGSAGPPTTTTETTATTGTSADPTTTTTTTSTTATTEADDTDDTSMTTTTGDPPSVCGNGIIEAGETCDEGELNADDAACTLDCIPAKCGDGLLQTSFGEECDEGTDNDNSGACTKDCKVAVCGDDHIQVGVEECDDGDDNNGSLYNGCIPGVCKLGPHCGDDILDSPQEECDQGPENGPQGDCADSCTWNGKLVFVSSVSYKGALGGLEGADTKCKLLADAAGLSNAPAFMAWLSDSTTSPSQRMTKHDGRYLLRDGTVIAKNWSEFVDGSLAVPINVTEKLEVITTMTAIAWTGTTAAGVLSDPAETCSDWSADTEVSGRWGSAKVISSAWTDKDVQGCSFPARLYCIEQ